jgi:hypothetical protein
MISIILTTTVNVNVNSHVFQRNRQERIHLYLKTIRQWLETGFNIIVVENSGYSYEELNYEKDKYKNRFEVIYYNQDDVNELKQLDSKGLNELYSINYAYDHSKLIHSSNFIIKITGRYYIKDLEDYLLSFDLNKYDCLTQNNTERCEMVGSHYSKFSNVFSNIYSPDMFINDPDTCMHYFDPYMERVWKNRTNKLISLKCKEFNIEKTIRGNNEYFITI